jgi:hypothetical protein
VKYRLLLLLAEDKIFPTLPHETLANLLFGCARLPGGSRPQTCHPTV